MNIKNAIRRLMEEQHVRVTDMAEATGVGKPAVSGMLGKNQRDMTFGKAIRMLDVLGYKVVLMPKAASIPVDCYEVTHEADLE